MATHGITLVDHDRLQGVFGWLGLFAVFLDVELERVADLFVDLSLILLEPLDCDHQVQGEPLQVELLGGLGLGPATITHIEVDEL